MTRQNIISYEEVNKRLRKNPIALPNEPYHLTLRAMLDFIEEFDPEIVRSWRIKKDLGTLNLK